VWFYEMIAAMAVRVLTVDMASPEDMAGIETTLAELGPQQVRRLAVLAKLEASAPNDYSYEPARRTLHAVLTAVNLFERTTSAAPLGACQDFAPNCTYIVWIGPAGIPTADDGAADVPQHSYALQL
jgi:hypothetical protein